MAPMGSNASYYPNNRPYEGGWQQQGGYYSQMYPPQMGVVPQSGPGGPAGAPTTEVCQIAVPNAAVGAIIGTAGSNIKQIMRDSGAFVNIESKKEDDPSLERLVSIKGSVDACWRASYMIFEKMKLEGFGGNEEVRLKTIIKIKKFTVGRIIGKSGKTVRELQRATGAMIKLPEDPSVQGDEVIVEVYGNFMATQGAQSRIRALANQTINQNYIPSGNPYAPRNGSYKSGPRRDSQPKQSVSPN